MRRSDARTSRSSARRPASGRSTPTRARSTRTCAAQGSTAIRAATSARSRIASRFRPERRASSASPRRRWASMTPRPEDAARARRPRRRPTGWRRATRSSPCDGTRPRARSSATCHSMRRSTSRRLMSMLWNETYYRWDGSSGSTPATPGQVDAHDVLILPDKWEYPLARRRGTSRSTRSRPRLIDPAPRPGPAALHPVRPLAAGRRPYPVREWT